MRNFPWFGSIAIVLAILAFSSGAGPGGRVGDVIIAGCLLVSGVIGIYARLILNRMDDARANPQPAPQPPTAS